MSMAVRKMYSYNLKRMCFYIMQNQTRMKAIILTFLLFVNITTCFSQSSTPMVIVTGAGGRTGKLVFSSLFHNKNYNVIGLVRTEKSARQLRKDVQCGLENLWVCDVTQLQPNGQNGLPKGVAGAEAMIICTSAVPKLRKRSLAKAFLKIPMNLLRGKRLLNFRDLQFYYNSGQYPEKVDYEGQVAQIELAKSMGISHVILVGSMGGTNPDDFLNTIGKDKDGNGNGDILMYKRKAEKHLVNSGLHYTIIHPGGLKDTPGGLLGLKLDINDHLLKEAKRSISRCDVARLCIASLIAFDGQNASFDCINCEIEDDGSDSTTQTPEVAIKRFLQSGKVYDYSK